MFATVKALVSTLPSSVCTYFMYVGTSAYGETDALVTLGPYQSALETGHNKAIYKFTVFAFTIFLIIHK